MKSLDDFEGANVDLGPPRDHDDPTMEITNLRVKFENGVFYSLWRPTENELKLLNEGWPVTLSVVGQGHPPVAVYVGEGS